MKRVVSTTHLEMRSRAALRPSLSAPAEAILLRAAVASPELNRFLYTAVGGDHFWLDRLTWTWADWMRWLDRPEHETWVLYWSGTPMGYFELERQETSDVEIAYLGLLPGFAGRGLGGYLLTQAVDRAWSLAPEVTRVWLHTCTLDHPAALANYLARGFSVFKEEMVTMDLPEAPPGPWPDARRPR